MNRHQPIVLQIRPINIQARLQAIYIYAFSRRFYPKWLTVHSGYSFFLSVHVFPGNRTHNLCAANGMLYHWATGTLEQAIRDAASCGKQIAIPLAQRITLWCPLLPANFLNWELPQPSSLRRVMLRSIWHLNEDINTQTTSTILLWDSLHERFAISFE